MICEEKNFFNDKTLSLGGLALVGAGSFYLTKQKSSSMPYSAKFDKINRAQKSHKQAIPKLLIDLDALDKNISTLTNLIPSTAEYRIVVKSLPSVGLVDYIMQKTRTNNLMVFHQPFLSHISETANDQVDILIGKPMPLQTARYYYENLSISNGFNPQNQLQWLVDTPLRTKEYISLAKELGIHLRLNIEIDVGLHRGGIVTLEELEAVLNLIQYNKGVVTFSGLMGYDPHIVKVPSIIMSKKQSYKKVKDIFYASKELIKNKFPELWNDNLTFNGAGSPTLTFHNNGDSPLNDIAAGSCLVKPTDFDIDTLKEFVPASYIVTPILKKMKNTEFPGGERLTGILSILNKDMKNSFFIYGGSWMADYHEPPEVKPNKIFGKSTNQVMINASDKSDLNIGDFVFLRPHQSEHVFLQFGNILTLRGNKIVDEWECFRNL